MGAVSDLDSYRNRAVLRSAVGNRYCFYEIANGAKMSNNEESVNMSDKIEVSALQLLYIISDSIDEFCSNRYDEDSQFDSLGFAQDKVVDIFMEHRKK